MHGAQCRFADQARRIASASEQVMLSRQRLRIRTPCKAGQGIACYLHSGSLPCRQHGHTFQVLQNEGIRAYYSLSPSSSRRADGGSNSSSVAVEAEDALRASVPAS